MNEEQKKSYLSILYNLRAGLSVISVEKEKYEQTKNSLEREKKEYISEVDYTKRTLERLHNEYKEVEVVLEKPMKEYSSKAYKSLFGGILGILLGVVCAVLFIMSLVQQRNPVAIFFCISDPEWGTEGLLLLLLFVPLILSKFLFSKGIELLRNMPTKFKEYSYRKKAPNLIRSLRESGIRQKQKMRVVEETFIKSQKDKTEQMKKIQQSCDCMLKALEKAYGKELDPRDWKYVDLMIYYLDSKRVDSVKEALQLIDEQVQRNKIADTLGWAIKDLKDMILCSATKVSQIMSNGFSLLSQQMNIMQSQVQAQNVRLQELINAQNMSNALKKKANENSMQLMEDVRYMRQIVEKNA